MICSLSRGCPRPYCGRGGRCGVRQARRNGVAVAVDAGVGGQQCDGVDEPAAVRDGPGGGVDVGGTDVADQDVDAVEGPHVEVAGDRADFDGHHATDGRDDFDAATFDRSFDVHGGSERSHPASDAPPQRSLEA